MSARQILDDNDPKIQYSSGWQEIFGLAAPQYEGTAHAAREGGATAQVSWRGTSGTIYGSAPASPGTIRWEWVLDGGQATILERPSQNFHFDGEVMADTGTLPDTDHTLLIRNIGDDSELRLDRIVLMVDNQKAAPAPTSMFTATPDTTTTSKSMTKSTTSGAQSTTTSLASLVSVVPGGPAVFTSSNAFSTWAVSASVGHPDLGTDPITSADTIGGSKVVAFPPATGVSSPNSENSASNHNGLSIGAIVGIAVGGTVALLLVVITILLYRLRSNKGLAQATGPETPSPSTTIFPSRLWGRTRKTNGVTPFDLAQSSNSATNSSPTTGITPTIDKRPRPFVSIPDQMAAHSSASSPNCSSHQRNGTSATEDSTIPFLSPRDEKCRLEGTSRGAVQCLNCGNHGPVASGSSLGATSPETFSPAVDSRSHFHSPIYTFTNQNHDPDDAPPAYPGLRQSMMSTLSPWSPNNTS